MQTDTVGNDEAFHLGDKKPAVSLYDQADIIRVKQVNMSRINTNLLKKYSILKKNVSRIYEPLS